MTTHRCPCGNHVKDDESYHRGFDLISSSGPPEFVYVHFCTVPCRDAWIKEAPIYPPPQPKQPLRIPSWGRQEYY